jgi:hypothetical protein
MVLTNLSRHALLLSARRTLDRTVATNLLRSSAESSRNLARGTSWAPEYLATFVLILHLVNTDFGSTTGGWVQMAGAQLVKIMCQRVTHIGMVWIAMSARATGEAPNVMSALQITLGPIAAIMSPANTEIQAAESVAMVSAFLALVGTTLQGTTATSVPVRLSLEKGVPSTPRASMAFQVMAGLAAGTATQELANLAGGALIVTGVKLCTPALDRSTRARRFGQSLAPRYVLERCWYSHLSSTWL